MIVLIRFEAKNHRSIRETVELSLVAIDQDREEARAAPLLGESLLSVAAIYGPNASGKSNVLAALSWVRDAVQNSLRFWEDEIPADPFAFGDGPTSPSEFVVELLIEGVRFEYVLELSRERIFYEALFHYPEKKRKRIFERDGTELMQSLGHLPRRPRSALAGFPRNSLPRQTYRLFEGVDDQLSLFSDDESDDLAFGGRKQALALLRLADLGIEDVVVDSQEISYPDSSEVRTQRRIRLLHKTEEESIPFDLNAESEGTRTWFSLIGPVLAALRTGSAVLFDELDASLHPTLSAELLRIFHSPATNPRGAQLFFTSHDTTRLGALSDFAGERVRKSQNLENAYLHGRFGALPQVDQTGFLRALGLIG